MASAPSTFQKVMENLHHGIEHVAVYIDDIMITGPSEDEYLCTLDKVLGVVEEAGMRLERQKVLSWSQRCSI